MLHPTYRQTVLQFKHEKTRLKKQFWVLGVEANISSKKCYMFIFMLVLSMASMPGQKMLTQLQLQTPNPTFMLQTTGNYQSLHGIANFLVEIETGIRYIHPNTHISYFCSCRKWHLEYVNSFTWHFASWGAKSCRTKVIAEVRRHCRCPTCHMRFFLTHDMGVSPP